MSFEEQRDHWHGIVEHIYRRFYPRSEYGMPDDPTDMIDTALDKLEYSAKPAEINCEHVWVLDTEYPTKLSNPVKVWYQCAVCGKRTERTYDMTIEDNGLNRPYVKVCPNDVVNHPKHYESRNGMECVDWIKTMLTPEEFRGYLKGAALKYQWRYNDKGKPVEDLKKSEWYIKRLIQEIEQ